MRMKVGMIGLGGMGKPIAECILRTGFELTVADLRPEQVAALVNAGAASAKTPAEVAEASDIVIASLPSNAASEDVALGPNGVLAGAKQGDVYIDTSTISPDVIRRVASAGVEKGIGVLDAPVSGSGLQRLDGTLTVMVGGDATTFELARPVLEAFGGNIFHVGPIGSGATIKLINNLVMASNAAAAMEGMLLGVKAGLTPEIIRDVLKVSSGGSTIFNNVADRILDTPAKPKPGDGPTHGLQTVSKDVRLASDLARSLGFPMIMGGAATQAWLAGDAKGLQLHEMWGLIEVFEDFTGVRLDKPQH
jgi:3-hydroxyisobutyrate dehydrogenase-like beta-hydroxyacid dehydrogenase